jgi:hypothetical protein
VLFRPANKCIDPIYGNPVSCDFEDDVQPNKKSLGKNTPTKIVVGGVKSENLFSNIVPKSKKINSLSVGNGIDESNAAPLQT